MADEPNYDLLKDAYAIIDGIPEQAIKLAGIRNKNGAVCSPAGRLALHPKFNQLGLTMAENGKQLLYKGNSYANGAYSVPLAQIFNLPVQDIVGLFAERGAHMGEVNPAINDKTIWQTRVLNYLRTHGQMKKTAVFE